MHRFARLREALSLRALRRGVLITATISASPSAQSRIGHFLLHYGEMCLPMCIGFALGDALYLRAAGSFGYSDPFAQLPELSVLVVTVAMTAPMTAWMLYRGMPRRATAEMSAAMPVLAIALLAFGWLGVVPRDDLALLEHGLMMPVMLVPMLARLDLYTGRAGHGHAPLGSRLRGRQRREIEGAESG